MSIDQIVLSPALYLTNAPGVSKQDALILAETVAATPPARTEILSTPVPRRWCQEPGG